MKVKSRECLDGKSFQRRTDDSVDGRTGELDQEIHGGYDLHAEAPSFGNNRFTHDPFPILVTSTPGWKSSICGQRLGEMDSLGPWKLMSPYSLQILTVKSDMWRVDENL